MTLIISRLLAKSAKELQDNTAIIPGLNDILCDIRALISTKFTEAEAKTDIILKHSNSLCPRFTGFCKMQNQV